MDGPLVDLLKLALAGGLGAGLVGIIAGIRGWRTDKWANDGNLITRLNEDSKQQGQRADRAELRERRWIDQASRYRRQVVEAGVTPDDTIWTEGVRNGER